MMGKQPVHVTDAEKKEFDDMTGERISAISDLHKLKKLEAYFSDYPVTLEAVKKRMQDLGSSNVHDDTDASADLAEFRAGLKPFAEQSKATEKELAAQKASRPSLSSGPAPRAPAKVQVAPVKPVARPDSYESDITANTNTKDQSASSAQKKDAKAKTAANPAATATAVVDAASTAKIVQLSAGMSEVERAYNAEREKEKGNEAFRAKEWREAVEHYTRSLGLAPDNASAYGNRAAAYLKLNMWDETIQDADVSLRLKPGNVKVLARRAAARLEKGFALEALQDIDTGLELEPGNQELQRMQERACKAVGINNTRRLAVEEVDGSETASSSTTVPAATDNKPKRTRIPVVEESDTEEEQEQAGSNAAPNMVTPAPPAATIPAPSATVTRTRIPVVEESDSEEEVELPQPPPTITPVAAADETVKTNASSAQRRAAAVEQGTKDVGKAAKPTTAAVEVGKGLQPKQAQPASAKQPPAAAAATASKTVENGSQQKAAGAVSVPAVKTLAEQAAELSNQAEQLVKVGNIARAQEMYTKAIDLTPDASALYLQRSSCKLRMSDTKGALEDAATAVALDPQHASPLHARARAKAKLGLLRSAMEDLKAADSLTGTPAEKKEMDKERNEHAAQLVKLVMQQKREKEAKKKQGAGVHRYGGGLVIEEHSDEEEEDQAEPGAKMSPGLLAKIESNAAKKAQQLRQLAATKQQQHLAAQQTQQNQSTQQKQPETAQPVTETKAELPSSSTSHQNVGNEQPAEPPLSPEEIKLKGTALFDKRQFEEARNVWESVLKMVYPDEQVAVDCQMNLAAVNLQLDNYPAALHHAQQAIKFDPHNKKSWHRKALALKGMGRLQEAMEAYRETMKIMKISERVENEIKELAKLIQAAAEPVAPQEPSQEPVPQQATQPEQATVTNQEQKPSTEQPAAHTPEPLQQTTSVAQTTAGKPAAGVGMQQPEASDATAAPEPTVEATGKATAQDQAKAKTTKPDVVETSVNDKQVAMSAAAASQQPTQVEIVPGQVTAKKQQTELSVEARKELAEKERKNGNEFYAKGELEAALKAYCDSAEHFPTDMAFSNQALVLAKLGRPAEAEQACHKALALAPHNFKANNRLGQALRAQGRHAEAIPYFEAALTRIKTPKERATVESELAETRRAAAAQSATKPQVAPASSTQKRKIEIEETGSSASEAGDDDFVQPSQPSPAAMHILHAANTHGSNTATSSMCSWGSEVAAEKDAASSENVTHGSVKTAENGKASTSTRTSSSKGSGKASMYEAAAAKAAAAAANLAVRKPAMPKSAVDFVNACKLIANDEQILSEYVKDINPASYTAIFKQSLDKQCLSYMLKGISHTSQSDVPFAVEALQALSNVSRFAMVWPMVAKTEKTVVADVLGRAAGQGSEVSELQRKYR